MIHLGAAILVASISLTTLNVINAELDLTKINSSPVNCDKWQDIVDECGLMMSYSFIHHKYDFPVTQEALTESCKRIDAATKCFKSYAKCMLPLSKQVANQVAQSRTKYNKKLCAPQPNAFSTRFLEMSQCAHKYNLTNTKGAPAELGAVLIPEAIDVAFPEANELLLKQSCCSVAHTMKILTEAAHPQCAKHEGTVVEFVDSFLGEAIGLICPELNPVKLGCDKLPKLKLAKRPKNRFFVKPIMEVVQKLAD